MKIGIKPFKNKKWILLLLLVAGIKIFSLFPAAVEQFYSNGLYIGISKLQRAILGWLQLSIGDVLYFLVVTWLLWKIISFIKKCFQKKIGKKQVLSTLGKVLFMILSVYVIFYGLWGLNYTRKGIAYQLQLPDGKYKKQDLDTLVYLLHQRINKDVQAVNIPGRDSLYIKPFLLTQGQTAYALASKEFSFLKNAPISVKPSLYSYLLNYTGVQGYYNPFTGEAQVNTTLPAFVQPFIITHEMAHQLGYAKESEANFVGFLTARKHPSMHFQYAVDFAMYAYANGELFWLDSSKAKMYDSTLHPQVKKDIADYRNFYMKYQNRIEPIITWIYGYYLKANNQPLGNRSYDEVVVWLIAYYKKFGKAAI